MLDRGLLSILKDEELSLVKAQKIFGFFDKSKLIELFIVILQGNELKTLELYRKMYDQGVDPKVFINDFLELLYYFKNINSLTAESTNFSLNDEEYNEIKKISESLDNKTLILFWQFTIKIMNELEIVSNQNLSIEMFLLRLIYLNGVKENKISEENINDNESNVKVESTEVTKEDISNPNKIINQIKNISQTNKVEPEKKLASDLKGIKTLNINSFNNLIEICNIKKEIKLKYELENNVNLVKFENLRIEISFNEKLDKNFVKDLTYKLHDWTGERWIITLSKTIGKISYKDQLKKTKNEEIEKIKNSKLFSDLRDKFFDINLIDIKNKDDEN